MLFDELWKRHDEIQNELGFAMDWQRLDNKKAYYIDVLDFIKHDNYDVLINKVIDKTIIIKEIFRKYINLVSSI